MGQIDVSDVLGDPDFFDDMQLVERRPMVNHLGENILKECAIPSFGVIQPATGRAVNRLPEALRVANMSSFWFKGLITASAPGKYTSVLVFRGVRYNVVTVFAWTNWGAGWCEGLSVAEKPS